MCGGNLWLYIGITVHFSDKLEISIIKLYVSSKPSNVMQHINTWYKNIIYKNEKKLKPILMFISFLNLMLLIKRIN